MKQYKFVKQKIKEIEEKYCLICPPELKIKCPAGAGKRVES